MAKGTILGRAKSAFDFTVEGKRRFGYTIWLGLKDDKFEGVLPFKFSINEDVEAFNAVMSAPVGAELEFYYGRFGGVDKDSIKVLK